MITVLMASDSIIFPVDASYMYDIDRCSTLVQNIIFASTLLVCIGLVLISTRKCISI